MAENRKLEEDELVKRLIPDPAQGPPNATPLRGYLGRSPSSSAKEPIWRLYRNAALDSYVEIPESEVLHHEKLPDEQGTIVWVAKSARLHHVSVHSAQVQAELLGSGSIAAGQLQPAPGTAGVAEPTLAPSIATVCSTVACPTRLCVSQPPCPSTQCHTIVTPCLSARPSECTLCPPPSAAGVSVCIHCPPPSAAGASVCVVCATPTATPSHVTICPTPTIRTQCFICPPPASIACTHAGCPPHVVQEFAVTNLIPCQPHPTLTCTELCPTPAFHTHAFKCPIPAIPTHVAICPEPPKGDDG
ncbi:MAG TPA: hypothetical protein VGY13_11160 [Solirubrobacteraceae bacterium]|jgi:hypothetical protein|nr:hypothetical protein [Solirubrobacteraceae bacterium]